MPFVATKDGYRREGNLKRLLKVGSPVFMQGEFDALMIIRVVSLMAAG